MFIGWSDQMPHDYTVVQIPYEATKDWILNIHYAKRMPSISYAYGLYRHDEMVGMVSYGSPASPSLCKGICGEEYKSDVIELNRLVLKDNLPNEASFLVAKSLKLLPKPKVVVSYADAGGHFHTGFVYQATNFLFTGTTRPRTDIAGKDGKHSRHHLGDITKRVDRTAKHRYVYFIGSKRERKVLREALRYPVLDYPKP
tara:strand:+ start:1480 stop:2076 length:597 start_codon:yes stop_codon:yes gene_type:complete